jgi:hypothetical protein
MAALIKQQAQYRSLGIPFDRNHRYHLSLASFPQFYDEAARPDRPIKTKIYGWTRGDAGKSHRIHSAERGTKIILAAANRLFGLRHLWPSGAFGLEMLADENLSSPNLRRYSRPSCKKVNLSPHSRPSQSRLLTTSYFCLKVLHVNTHLQP